MWDEDIIVDLLQCLSPFNKKRKAKLLNTAVDRDHVSKPILHNAVKRNKLNIVNMLLDEGAGKCVKFLMLNMLH